jgi:DnaJ-class molecular chaperone
VFRAVLGGEVRIPSLVEPLECVNVKLEPGTQSNQVLCVPGQGYHKPACKKKRGDLLLKMRVEIPRYVNNAQKELWEKLMKISETPTFVVSETTPIHLNSSNLESSSIIGPIMTSNFIQLPPFSSLKQ